MAGRSVPQKWRPTLAMIVFAVLLTVLVLPALIVVWFRYLEHTSELRPIEIGALAVALVITVVIAVVFLLIAADIGLTAWIGPLWAAIAIALAAIVIALVIFIALRVQMAARQRRRAEQRRQTESTAMATAALTVLPELLENPLVRNVGVPVAIYAALLLFAPKRKK